MKHYAPPSNARGAQESRSICFLSPSESRLAFTPTAFAALAGRSSVWGYRQIYSGKVRVLKLSSRLMIPRSEVEKFFSLVTTYVGKKAKKSNVPTSEDGLS